MRTTRHPRKPSLTTLAHLDELLDEALRETFPASDPIAVANERGTRAIVRTFKTGDHVSWNSEAGRVSGRIVRVHTSDVTYKGYVRHACEDILSMRLRATRPITSLCTRAVRYGIFAAE